MNALEMPSQIYLNLKKNSNRAPKTSEIEVKRLALTTAFYCDIYTGIKFPYSLNKICRFHLALSVICFLCGNVETLVSMFTDWNNMPTRNAVEQRHKLDIGTLAIS